MNNNSSRGHVYSFFGGRGSVDVDGWGFWAEYTVDNPPLLVLWTTILFGLPFVRLCLCSSTTAFPVSLAVRTARPLGVKPRIFLLIVHTFPTVVKVSSVASPAGLPYLKYHWNNHTTLEQWSK